MPPDVASMILSRLEAIESRLDDINRRMLDHPPCPSPGACIPLTATINATLLRIDRTESRILGLEKWRSWITGAVAVIGTLVPAAIGYILTKLL